MELGLSRVPFGVSDTQPQWLFIKRSLWVSWCMGPLYREQQQHLMWQQKKRSAMIQQTALLWVPREYWTVHHEAVQVLVGCIPIDLLLQEDYIIETRWRGKAWWIYWWFSVWESVKIQIDGRGFSGRTHKKNPQRVTTLIGATLRKYFPIVSSRMGPCGQLQRGLQFLTRHGGFLVKFVKHGKNIDTLCLICGVSETSKHIGLLWLSCLWGTEGKTGKGLYEQSPSATTKKNYLCYKSFTLLLGYKRRSSAEKLEEEDMVANEDQRWMKKKKVLLTVVGSNATLSMDCSPLLQASLLSYRQGRVE